MGLWKGAAASAFQRGKNTNDGGNLDSVYFIGCWPRPIVISRAEMVACTAPSALLGTDGTQIAYSPAAVS